MKEKIVNSNDSSRNVVYSTIRGVGIVVLRALGNFDNLFRLLRRHRQTTFNPLPYQNEYLKLNSILLQSHLGNAFYQYGPGNYRNLQVSEDILIFYSSDAIARLKENGIYAVDETFIVVPVSFLQLYTISYIRDHQVFPVVLALLKNKSQETYKSLFPF